MSRNRAAIKEIGLSFVFKPIGVLISLILVPMTISYLGSTVYGIWATILSVITWINFFDIGIGNGLRNHLTARIADNDYKDGREYIATAYAAVAVISLLMVALMGIISWFVDWNTVFNTSLFSGRELFLVMLINYVFICINFVMKLVSSLYFALQKASMVGLIQLVNQLFILVGIFIIRSLPLSNPILGISLIYGAASLLSYIIFTAIIFRNYKALIPGIKDIKLSKTRGLISLGLKFFILQITYIILFTSDNMIITQLFGPDAVTPYNITYKAFSVIIMVHGIVITPVWSAVTKAHTENDIKWIRSLLKKLNLILLPLGAGAILLSLLFPYLVRYWIGKDISSISGLLTFNFLIYAILSIMCNNYSHIFNGLGEINFQLKLSIIQAVINIPASIFLAKNLQMGISGVILGTNLTLLIGALYYPFITIRLFNRLENSVPHNRVEVAKV